MLARAAGDSPSFVKLPVNHATTASGLNHHDYHSHTNKPPRRAARPHTGRYTRYVALHPFRTGALPTDRVHRPRQQAQTRIRTPPRAQAVHHPLLRRTTWTDIALLTRQRNAPHLAQHSHSQTQPRRASQPHRAPHPQQGTAPVMWRCTSYVALHPFRTGALPTDRVHRPRQQAQTRIRTPPRAQAVHHPLLRRTTWTDIALLTRQRNAPHLAQHSHSQTQPRRASQPHRAPHPQQGTAPVMWRCTSYVALHPIRTGALPTDRVHCLQIGCSAHTHKPNRGEHPAARSLRPATVRTFTNSARNSLTATRNNTPETAGFQRSDFKS